jgi:hypothetical protein
MGNPHSFDKWKIVRWIRGPTEHSALRRLFQTSQRRKCEAPVVIAPESDARKGETSSRDIEDGWEDLGHDLVSM